MNKPYADIADKVMIHHGAGKFTFACCTIFDCLKFWILVKLGGENKVVEVESESYPPIGISKFAKDRND